MPYFTEVVTLPELSVEIDVINNDSNSLDIDAVAEKHSVDELSDSDSDSPLIDEDVESYILTLRTRYLLYTYVGICIITTKAVIPF